MKDERKREEERSNKVNNGGEGEGGEGRTGDGEREGRRKDGRGNKMKGADEDLWEHTFIHSYSKHTAAGQLSGIKTRFLFFHPRIETCG